LTADRGEVKAGEPLTIHVTFRTPTSYDTYCYLDLRNAAASDTIEIGSQIKAKQTTADLTGPVPTDAKGGTYTAIGGGVGPPPGARNNVTFTVNPISVNIIPVADETTHPAEATLALSLTQEQLLRTASADVQQILSTLIARLNSDAADTVTLRQYLVTTLKKGDALLLKTKGEYAAKAAKNLNPEPIFFDDLHQEYLTAITDLGVPDPKQGELVTTTGHLIRVQLSGRSNSVGGATALVNAPLVAKGVIAILKRNIAAYENVEKHGTEAFTIKLRSIPAGATVSYMRTGHPYTTYSKPTNIEDASFQLAMWTFRFEKSGCKTQFREVDPYTEANPELTVELSCTTK